MLDGEDWLFRPVQHQLIRGESLLDGTVDLAYIELLNELLDVAAENKQRAERNRNRGH
jgi:hypothetical protein